jgi:hypothetical protein
MVDHPEPERLDGIGQALELIDRYDFAVRECEVHRRCEVVVEKTTAQIDGIHVNTGVQAVVNNPVFHEVDRNREVQNDAVGWRCERQAARHESGVKTCTTGSSAHITAPRGCSSTRCTEPTRSPDCTP